MRRILHVAPILAVAVTCSVAAGSSPAATIGSGGSSIATAHPLPLGHFVTSGWTNQNNGEFWRVRLHPGDRLTLDYGNVGTNCDHVDVGIYAPTVTDFTIGNSDSIASDSAYGKHELVWVAPVTGSWIVHFSACSTNSYRFRAAVRIFGVPVVVSGPSIARAHPLPIGRLFSSGWVNQDPGEFWRVTLHTGDRLTVDYANVSSNCDHVDLAIYAPNVTDYTLGNTNSIASDSAYGSHELVWVAPRAGRWIVHFSACSTNGFKFKARVHRR
jgi:hypothetical protein